MLFLLFVIALIQSVPLEFCKKFEVYHRFRNCPDTSSEVDCANEGTWPCAEFNCFNPHPDDEDGYCSHGWIKRSACASVKDMCFADIWVTIDADTGTDFHWSVFNYDISSNIGHFYLNGTTLEDVYSWSDPGPHMFHLGLSFEHDDLGETALKFYINGTLEVEKDNHDLDLYFLIFLRSMQYINDLAVANEKVYSTGMSTVCPTAEQVKELYELGPDRSPDHELCYTEDIMEANGIDSKRRTWKGVGIAFIVLFIIALIGIPIAIIITFFIINQKLKKSGKKRPRETRYLEMIDESNVKTSGIPGESIEDILGGEY